MKKISIPYYMKFLLFNLVFNGLFIGMLFAFDKPNSEDVHIVLFRFFGLFMFAAGFYIVSFIYGMYFQYQYKLSGLEIELLTVLLFFVEVVSFFPLWQPDLFKFDLKTQYLLSQAAFQTASFLAGSFLIKFIIYLKQVKKK